MTIILVVEMSFLFFPRSFHEILGLAFLIPLFFHLRKNRGFLKSLPRGRWKAPRIIMAVSGFLVAVTFLATMISGCLISNLFSGFVPSSVRINPVLYEIHRIAARGFLMAAGFHLGIHLDGWWQRLLHVLHISRGSLLAKAGAGILIFLTAAAGIFAAVEDRFWERLMGAPLFMTPALRFHAFGYILVQLAVFLLFAEAGWLLWRLSGQRR